MRRRANGLQLPGRVLVAALLRKWKTDHEGSNGPALAALGAVDKEMLTELLVGVFSPPIERLQKIADQLEATGTLTAGTVAELARVLMVLGDAPAGPDMTVAGMLAEAASIYGHLDLRKTAGMLLDAAAALERRVTAEGQSG